MAPKHCLSAPKHAQVTSEQVRLPQGKALLTPRVRNRLFGSHLVSNKICSQTNAKSVVVRSRFSNSEMENLVSIARQHTKRRLFKYVNTWLSLSPLLRLSETVCLMCHASPRQGDRHFCGKTCADEAASKGPIILEVPVGHVTFNSGTCAILEIMGVLNSVF